MTNFQLLKCMSESQIIEITDHPCLTCVHRDDPTCSYEDCKKGRKAWLASEAKMVSHVLSKASTELHKVSDRPKSEQYVCISCGKFCYYPHSNTAIPYKFCPNCGKVVRGHA